jgi:hypothetical protein
MSVVDANLKVYGIEKLHIFPIKRNSIITSWSRFAMTRRQDSQLSTPSIIPPPGQLWVAVG